MTAQQLTAKATVARVVDGDTFAASAIPLGLRVGLIDVRVRVDRINAPENSTPEGQAATAYIKTLVEPGDVLTITSPGPRGSFDNYGRVVADVTLPDGRDWGQVMIDSGHAVAVVYRVLMVGDNH